MSSPSPLVSQPRLWLLEPPLFGTRSEVPWRPDPTGSDGEAFRQRAAMRAAQLQHQIVVVAVSRLRLHGYKNLIALARDDFELSYSQLNRIVNGSSHMSLQHVAALEERLGPLIEIVLTDLE